MPLLTAPSKPARATGTATTLDRVIADGHVVVGQLLSAANEARRADPDCGVDHFEPAVGRAGVIDEAGDVAAGVGVAAPGAVHAKHPDAAVGEVARLARRAARVRDQLARVIDDAAVFCKRRRPGPARGAPAP